MLNIVTVRTIFVLVLCANSIILEAQDIKLENLWAKGSDKIYSGTNNYLRIEGDVNAITRIDANAGVQRQHDTLLLMPSPGKVQITIHTAAGKTAFTYEAISMPTPKISFICQDQKKIAPTVKLGIDSTDGLFSHYKIVQYTVLINNKERTGQFDYLTSEVLSAIDNIPAGKKFHIKYILLYNKETNHYIESGSDLSFELDYAKKGTGNFTNTCIADYIKSLPEAGHLP